MGSNLILIRRLQNAELICPLLSISGTYRLNNSFDENGTLNWSLEISYKNVSTFNRIRHNSLSRGKYFIPHVPETAFIFEVDRVTYVTMVLSIEVLVTSIALFLLTRARVSPMYVRPLRDLEEFCYSGIRKQHFFCFLYP